MAVWTVGWMDGRMDGWMGDGLLDRLMGDVFVDGLMVCWMNR
jgi:hypothetical protein